MTEDILGSLKLVPADVPNLPAASRNSLISYLLHWEHYDAARRCLQQLLVTHSHLVTIYNELARALLGLGQPERALEIVRRRHAIKVSNSSRILEARACLAAGRLAEAQAIATTLTGESPDLLSGWSLQADVCLAAGDPGGAEAALQRRESLATEAAATALGMARVWQARGDPDKALLWARTALSRTERDEHHVPVELLRLLKTLYAATGQAAQAEAIHAQLQQREQQELDELRAALDPTLPAAPAGRKAAAPQASPPGILPGLAVPQAAEAPFPRLAELAPAELGRLKEALHRYFPHTVFRPGQAEAITPVLRGESVLAVMPTGAGKSLCYQLAAMLLPGTALVVSPLVALMKDQLDGLPDGVAAQATTLNYTLEGSELEARLGRAAAGGYKLLYAAPERLRQRPFLHALNQAGVSLLVVDEAHCVSLWGHDFRPDYLFIVKAWQELGQPPIMALTATATPRVRDDIQAALGEMKLIATDVERPNLRFEARRFTNSQEKTRALVELCRELPGSGIVYANSRAHCEELAKILRRAGVNAIHYHAGLDDRAAAQDEFMSGRARVVVATIAFGMGIDKPDVRFIIHFHPPRTLENYYQEAGRAGRDGLPARCILFHAPSDKSNLTHWTRQDSLSVEFLRGVYNAVQHRLGAAHSGLIALADLERDLAAGETSLRVAIHFLETAGLVWRGFDLPRMATLGLRRLPEQPDPDLVSLVQAARLRPGDTIARDLTAVARDAGLDARTVESSLLKWADAGWLEYRGTGRDMLLALPTPPPDSRERVAALLADYISGQEGRIAEIMSYAGTRLCRHGYISAYFGGRTIQHCQSCDNCLDGSADSTRAAPSTARAPQSVRPAVRPRMAADLKLTILEGVASLPYPLGRTGLTNALRGIKSSPVRPERFPLFGALAGLRGEQVATAVIELVEAGLLASFQKGAYRLLRLTDAGRAWIETHGKENTAPPAPPARDASLATASPAVSPAAAPTGRADAEPAAYDAALFERLRSWRRQVAQQIGKPPYIVLPDATLKAVAAARPATVGELAAIRGIGPAKLEHYGAALLAIVAGREPEPLDSTGSEVEPPQK